MAQYYGVTPINFAKMRMSEETAATTANPAQQQGLFGDSIDAAQMGAANAVGGVLDMVGADGLARSMYKIAGDQTNQMSDRGREAMSKEFFTRDEQGDLSLGDAATDLDSYILNLAALAGNIGVTLPAGGALGAATKVGSTIGMGTVGGAAATGMQAEQARQEVFRMPDELIAKSPKFAEVMAMVDQQFQDEPPEEKFKIAKASIAEMMATEVKADPKTLLANFAGSALADPILGRALTGARIAQGGIRASAFRGGVVEGVTEAGQAGISQYAMNEILQPLDNRDAMQGVVEAGLTEGLLGSTAGAGIGAFGGAVNRGPSVEIKKGDAPVAEQTSSPTLDAALNELANNTSNAQIVVNRPAAGAPLAQNAEAKDEDRWGLFESPTIARKEYGTDAPQDLGRVGDNLQFSAAMERAQPAPSVVDLLNTAPQQAAAERQQQADDEASAAVKAAFGDVTNQFRQINQASSPVQQALQAGRSPTSADLVADQMTQAREQQADAEGDEATAAVQSAFGDAARTVKMNSERWQRRMPAVVPKALEGEVVPPSTGLVPAGNPVDWNDLKTGKAAYLRDEDRVVIAGQDPSFNPNAPQFSGKAPDPIPVPQGNKRIGTNGAMEMPDNSGVMLKPDNTTYATEADVFRSPRAKAAIAQGQVVTPVPFGDSGYGFTISEAPDVGEGVGPVNLRANDKPFKTAAEALASTAARKAKANGETVTPVKSGDGYGWVSQVNAPPQTDATPEAEAEVSMDVEADLTPEPDADVDAESVPEPEPEKPTGRRLTEEGRADDGKAIMPGDVFLTATDRQTTPYPKQKSAKAANQWLIDNAVAEARARGNKTAERNFLSASATNFTPADRDSMMLYLADAFDAKAPEPKAPTKDLSKYPSKEELLERWKEIGRQAPDMQDRVTAGRVLKSRTGKSALEMFPEFRANSDVKVWDVISTEEADAAFKQGQAESTVETETDADGDSEQAESAPEPKIFKTNKELVNSKEYKAAKAYAAKNDVTVDIERTTGGWTFEIKKFKRDETVPSPNTEDPNWVQKTAEKLVSLSQRVADSAIAAELRRALIIVGKRKTESMAEFDARLRNHVQAAAKILQLSDDGILKSPVDALRSLLNQIEKPTKYKSLERVAKDVMDARSVIKKRLSNHITRNGLQTEINKFVKDGRDVPVWMVREAVNRDASLPNYIYNKGDVAVAEALGLPKISKVGPDFVDFEAALARLEDSMNRLGGKLPERFKAIWDATAPISNMDAPFAEFDADMLRDMGFDPDLAGSSDIAKIIRIRLNSLKSMGKIRFNKDVRSKPVKGLSTAKVMSVVDEALSKIGDMKGITVEVVPSQDRYSGMAADDIVKGFYQNGKVILIAENLGSATDVRRTLMHELLAHGGLDMVIGKDASREILDKIVRTRNVPSFKQMWADADRNYDGETDLVKAEEIFAKFTETAPEQGTMRYWWNQLVNTIKRMLSDAGLWTSDMTKADMQKTLDAIKAGFQFNRSGGAKSKAASSFGTGNMGDRLYAKDAKFDTANEDALKDLLRPAGQTATIGAEKGTVKPNGVSKLTSDFGSTRYVYSENGKILSAVQVMARPQYPATVTNVYTDPSSRRKGLAAQLYNAAKKDFKDLRTSDDLSKDGAAWVSSVEQDPVRYSKTRNYETMATPEVDEILKKAHAGVLGKARDAMKSTGIWDKAKANWMAALTLGQLTEQAAKLFPKKSFNRYNDVYQQYVADVQTAATDASFLANDMQKWAAGNKDAADAMFELAHDATIYGIDADPKVTSGTPKAELEARLAALDQDLADATAAQQTNRVKQIRKEIKATKAEIEDYDDATYIRRRDELRKRFNDMPEEAKKHYRAMRTAYQRRRNEAFSVQKRELEAMADMAKQNKNAAAYASARKALSRLSMEQRIAHLSGPYFPLTRFGDYFTDLKRPDGERVFLMHESEADMVAAVKAFEEAGWSIERKGKTEQFMREDGMSSEVLDALGRIVENSGLENDAVDGLKDQIFQMYLQYLPSRSIRKNLMHRKNVRGFSQDAVRAFALSMSKSSNQISRMKHMPAFTQALRDTNGQVREFERNGDPSDAVKARYMLEELRKRHENIMNPTESKVAQAITGLGFTWLLGLSPAAAVINLTQTATVAGPVLAAKLGISLPKALALMTKELKNMRLMTTRSGERLITLRGSDEVNNDPVLRAAYVKLERMGVIDLTRAHDLVGISETGGFQYGGKFHKAMSFVSKFFHNAEVINREITAIAAFKVAYQQALDKGLSDSDAFQEGVSIAADLTRESHFDYSSGNRARFMQGNAAKVAFQFKQYSQQMTYYLVRNAWRSLPWGDLSAAEKKQARAQLFGTLMTTGFIGGLSALPLSVLYAIINSVVPEDEDEKPFDAKQEFYTFIAQNFGKDLANTAIYGVGGAGLSSRIQLNDLWLRDPSKNLEGAAAYGNYVLQLLGPVAGGIIPNMVQGATLLEEGQYQKGVEKMIPKAFKDISVSERYASDGATNLRGDVIKEDFNYLELFLQAIGLADSEVTARYEENAAIKGVETAIKKRRQSLMDKYFAAQASEDQESLAEVNAAIERFNGKNPDIRINRRSLLQSMRTRKKRTEETKAGLYLDKNMRYLEEQIDWL